MQREEYHIQSIVRDGVVVSGNLTRLWLDSALASLAPEVLETALVCAIPAWFDLRLMVLLTGMDELSVVTHLVQLVAVGLVSPAEDGGYSYHAVVRKYLLGAWAMDTRWRQYVLLIEILAQHYLSLAAEQTARLRGADQPAALALLDRLYPNLEALWEAAIRIGYGRLVYKLVAVMDAYHSRRTLWMQKIAWLESGLTACDWLGYKTERAELLNSLGVAYMRCRDDEVPARVQKAVACYQQALTYFSPQTYPLDYAMVQNNLGNAYMHMAESTQGQLPRAIACYEEALRYCCIESAQLSYAIIHSNLGHAYSQLDTGDHAQNLQRTIAHYREALRVYTWERLPAVYARLQINLGVAYAALSLDAPTLQEQMAHLGAMLVCYEAALKFYTFETAPAEFAQIQADMARAHTLLAAQARAPHLRRAIECYRAALRVYTLETAPQQFAEIWVALGVLYSQAPGYGEAVTPYLHSAIACYQEALRVYTLEATPQVYAEIQVYLGTAYAGLSAGDRASDLLQAWLSYHEAIKGMVLGRLPPAYTQLHHYLGCVYERLATLDSHANLLQAIACYEASLTVFTPETAPQANAHIHNKLDTLYAQLHTPRRSPAEVASAR
ncbi:MAG TPA: hypothetical protein PKH77_06195 [Anaerolineae bacterium]|nr:hypothetical protein [Anaerolineae bacterium]